MDGDAQMKYQSPAKIFRPASISSASVVSVMRRHPERKTPGIAPGGTLHASLADWAKYAAMHLKGAKGRTDYLKPETFARIQAAPKEGDYAFGWGHAKRPWANGRLLTHTGSNTMWFAVIWLAPERDVAFLAVCNSGVEAAPRATDEAIGAAMTAVKDQLPPLAK